MSLKNLGLGFGVYYNNGNESYTIEDTDRCDGYLLYSFGGYNLIKGGFNTYEEAEEYLDYFKNI